MVEKEERILVARSSDYTLTDTDKGELFKGKIEPLILLAILFIACMFLTYGDGIGMFLDAGPKSKD